VNVDVTDNSEKLWTKSGIKVIINPHVNQLLDFRRICHE